MKKTQHIVKTIIYYALIVFISYTFMSKIFAIDSFQLNIAKTGLFKEIMVYLVSYFALTIEAIAIIFLIFKKI
jgi:hypothetical protein